MRSSCSTCGRALQAEEAHRVVCRRCEIRIRGWLREIDLQRPLLDASLHIGSAPAQGQIGGTGRAHAPLPLREDVLTLIGPGAGGTVPDPHGDQTGPLPLDALLQNWAQAVAELIRFPTHMPRPSSHGPVGPDALPAPHPGGTWSTWLTAYLPQALTASWFSAFYAEVADLIHHIRAITLSEPQRRRKEAPCPHCHAFTLFEEDWETYLDCANCELLLTPDEYRAHRDAVMPTLYWIGVLMAAAATEETPSAMTDATVATRRATAARMKRDGASLRTIATRLGVSKDTIRRDLAAIETDTAAPPDQGNATPGASGETPDATPRPTREQRVALAQSAMRQLGLAVTAAVDARPSHAIVSDTVALGWAAELRQHIATLTALADDFNEYYAAPPTTPIAHPYGNRLDKDRHVASH